MNNQITSPSFTRPKTEWLTSGMVGDVVKSVYGTLDRWIEAMQAESSLVAAYEVAKTDPQRWDAIRAYYSFFRNEIAITPAHKWATDPYGLPVHSRFTPIEKDAWDCIRIHGLVMYPQYPALGYFLDFANPVLKVAIEMDGRGWHDPVRDAQRDARLMASDWTVYRIPGGHCLRQLPCPEELRGQSEEITPEYERAVRDWFTKTSEGVITAIGAKHFGQGECFTDEDRDYYGESDDWQECRSEAISESLSLHRSTGRHD
jgi:hypothetical protein